MIVLCSLFRAQCERRQGGGGGGGGLSCNATQRNRIGGNIFFNHSSQWRWRTVGNPYSIIIIITSTQWLIAPCNVMKSTSTFEYSVYIYICISNSVKHSLFIG